MASFSIRYCEQAARARKPDVQESHFADGMIRIADRHREMFTEQFKAILRNSGTKIVRTSIQAPNMNAFTERFVRSTKFECLDRMIFVGADSLDRAVREFTVHHAERPHQGIENALIAGGPIMNEGRVEVRDRLGGLLRYHRQAA